MMDKIMQCSMSYFKYLTMTPLWYGTLQNLRVIYENVFTDNTNMAGSNLLIGNHSIIKSNVSCMID